MSKCRIVGNFRARLICKCIRIKQRLISFDTNKELFVCCSCWIILLCCFIMQLIYVFLLFALFQLFLFVLFWFCMSIFVNWLSLVVKNFQLVGFMVFI